MTENNKRQKRQSAKGGEVVALHAHLWCLRFSVQHTRTALCNALQRWHQNCRLGSDEEQGSDNVLLRKGGGQDRRERKRATKPMVSTKQTLCSLCLPQKFLHNRLRLNNQKQRCVSGQHWVPNAIKHHLCALPLKLLCHVLLLLLYPQALATTFHISTSSITCS